MKGLRRNACANADSSSHNGYLFRKPALLCPEGMPSAKGLRHLRCVGRTLGLSLDFMKPALLCPEGMPSAKGLRLEKND